LAPFEIDDATSAWVLCRFAFIWVVFGYVAVPAYALLVDTPVMDLTPKTQAASLLAAEAGKLVALNAMLDAELGPTRTPRRRCFRSAENHPVPFAALWNTHDVALGVACGALASVAARAADGITATVSSLGDESVAAASSALDLYASIRGDAFALVAAAAASALVAPAAEELFFRGFLLPAVCERFRKKNNGRGNEPAAVAVVAATFAAAHFSPSDFPALFVAGAVFGAASLGSRTRGGLVAPFLAHATFNALVLAEYVS
jgi:membrane protease YdiL (CAAX protease family)